MPSSELASFLSAMWPDTLGKFLLIWGAPSKRSAFINEVTADEIAAIEVWATRENTYVGCALRAQNMGPADRGKKADCVAIPGVWIDLDYGSEHKKPNLPPTEEDAKTLLADMGLPPTAVIHSGRGLQAWWLFKEPWVFDDDADRVKAEALTMGWCSTLRARAKARGWDADQVGDITRVMRLPGTWNRKGVAKKTRLLSLTEARYDPSDLEAYLLPETEEKKASPKLKWAYDIIPAAEPPAEKFMRLCEIDSAFKSAWEHTRTDLADQSASSYDLSLATKAFAASWTAQEVVNLLVAHRRLRGGQEKSNPRDYYDRTLNAAMAGKGVEERRALANTLKNGEALPEHVAKDPAEILGLVSDRLGVSITKFVRFRGGTNTYQLEIEGHTIDVSDIEMLDSQANFRRLLLDYTDKRIEEMNKKDWHMTVSHLFAAIENVQVAQDATRKGAYENWVEIYLSEHLNGGEDWEKAAFQNQAFKKDGHVYFVAEGFRTFLHARFQERVSGQQLTRELTTLGYAYERKTIRTNKGLSSKRSIWRLP